MKYVIVLFLILLGFSNASFAADALKESAYDRVMRTGILRCGYILFPPMLTRDDSSKIFSGISADILAELSHRLSIKIEWTEESGLDTILQGLNTGRYDVVCHPLYANAARARVAFFTDPMFFQPLYMVTRADDYRFDKDFSILNDPGYQIATLEGEASAIIARQRYPKAQIHAIPQIQGFGFVLKDLAIGKADATFSDKVNVDNYNKSNAEKIKILNPPLLVNAVSYPVAQDEKLRQMLGVTLAEMQMDGWINNLIRTKYPDFWANILPKQMPYAEQ